MITIPTNYKALILFVMFSLKIPTNETRDFRNIRSTTQWPVFFYWNEQEHLLNRHRHYEKLDMLITGKPESLQKFPTAPTHSFCLVCLKQDLCISYWAADAAEDLDLIWTGDHCLWALTFTIIMQATNGNSPTVSFWKDITYTFPNLGVPEDSQHYFLLFHRIRES